MRAELKEGAVARGLNPSRTEDSPAALPLRLGETRRTAVAEAAFRPLTPRGLAVPAEARAALARVVEQLAVDLADQAHRIILVTSAESGEGVSSIASWLLAMLAETQDGELLYLDASAPPGAAPLPAPQAPLPSQDTANATRSFALDLRNASGGRRLAAHDLIDALGTLRERFAWIVVDGAPPTVSPLTLAVAQHADGVLLVVEANRTDRERVQAAGELIRRSGGRLAGAVLNKRRR